jgi:hypothetical protein
MAAERVGERAHCGARIEMTLGGEEETVAKARRKIGLERGDPRLIGPLMPARALGEAVDLGDVARRSDDQRAGANDPGDTRLPPVDRTLAKLDHAPGRAFALAERRQHAARKPRRVAAKVARPLDERHLRTALGERRCGHKPYDSCAYDDDAAHRCRVSLGVEPQALLRPSP